MRGIKKRTRGSTEEGVRETDTDREKGGREGDWKSEGEERREGRGLEK